MSPAEMEISPITRKENDISPEKMGFQQKWGVDRMCDSSGNGDLTSKKRGSKRKVTARKFPWFQNMSED
jgi:hypothetical protein